MWPFTTKTVDVQEVIVGYPSKDKMAERIADLEAQVKQWEKYRDDLINLQRNDPVILDFNSLHVFSIERTWKKEEYPVTVVGYWRDYTECKDGVTITGKKLGEWYLNISDERHAEVVADYKAWLSKK